ncbi:hypothetical protein [Rhodospirillum centenum]|uniref:Uncharacterized protein n=1 Tax=Rhodospirillum centenum (strain ATCC 51521 / SW) TaxID=414684 RepID=B6IUH2_RHOCS|nr:hypothetical protein [Rhodospirillum centenum]ACI99797.1 hypothetical protein RC1_2412 [Rhodospirillum centenum SW]
MIDDAWIESLPEDPWLALSQCVEIWPALRKSAILHGGAQPVREWNTDRYDDFIQIYAVCTTITRNIGEIITGEIEFAASAQANMEKIDKYMEFISAAVQRKMTDIRVMEIRRRTGALLRTAPGYTLTEGDIERAQNIINELRGLIAASDSLEERFRQRLLRKLESLQSELHKRMSDFDRVYGMIADASVLMRKIGEDAKPIVERIRELVGIAWRSQAQGEELSSDTPPPQIGTGAGTGAGEAGTSP